MLHPSEKPFVRIFLCDNECKLKYVNTEHVCIKFTGGMNLI